MAGTQDEQIRAEMTTTLTHRLPKHLVPQAGRVREIHPPLPASAGTPSEDRLAHGATQPEAVEPSASTKAPLWRPYRQAPLLVVTALRADGAPGQTFFVRGDSAVCGRDPCDIHVANDASLSKRHFELARIEHEGAQLWEIRDLQSSGGIWVRVDNAWLYKGAEIIVGNTRFRFVGEGEASAEAAPSNRDSTQVLSLATLHGGELLRREPRGGVPGRDFVLKKRDKPLWLGTDPQCDIACEDDEFVDRRHAQMEYDPRTKRWRIEDKGSTNGIWFRRTSHRVSFDNPELIVRAGEQVFTLRMDSHA